MDPPLVMLLVLTGISSGGGGGVCFLSGPFSVAAPFSNSVRLSSKVTSSSFSLWPFLLVLLM